MLIISPTLRDIKDLRSIVIESVLTSDPKYIDRNAFFFAKG